jgi:hypothetical protein
VTVRLRRASEVGFEARWPDGHKESPPPDRTAELAGAVAAVEREIVTATEQTRVLAERLQQGARVNVHRRVELVAAEAHRDPPAPKPVAPPKRGWLGALFARLLAWVRRLFGRSSPALEEKAAPTLAPAPDPRQALVALLSKHAQESARDSEALESELRASKAHLAALIAQREERRRELEGHPAARQRAIETRLRELSAFAAPVEIEIGAPAVPEDLVLLLRPPGEGWHEPIDGTLSADDVPAGELRTRLEGLRDRHPQELVRRIIAALCSVRNEIVDLTDRARKANEQQLADLRGARVADPKTLRQREGLAARRELARQTSRVMDESAARLEKLLEDVRKAWESRLEGCSGLEQLRAEAAAVEDGAQHRLTLAYDELRESMTVQCVRLVLELTRSLRQELLQKRLAVARGSSPKTDEAFAQVRVGLPASLDTAFRALVATGVGQLLPASQGLLDPLFRTLAKTRRECLTRLRARLDEIQHDTTRELFASAVFLTPLLRNTLEGLFDELLEGHERWIADRIDDEQRRWNHERVRQQPALDLVPTIEKEEASLARVVEAASAP